MYIKEILLENVKLIPPSDRITFPEYKKENFQNLKKSIKENGILQSLLVIRSDDDDHYVLLAGYNRYKIAKEIGLKTIPCTVVTNLKGHSISYSIGLGLTTDIDRRHLSPDEISGILAQHQEMESRQMSEPSPGGEAIEDQKPTADQPSAVKGEGAKKTSKPSPGKPGTDADMLIADLKAKITKLQTAAKKKDGSIKTLEEEKGRLEEDASENLFEASAKTLMSPEEIKKEIDEKIGTERAISKAKQVELDKERAKLEGINAEVEKLKDEVTRLQANKNMMIIYPRWTFIARHILLTVQEQFEEMQNRLEGNGGIIERLQEVVKTVTDQQVNVERDKFIEYLEKKVMPSIETAIKIARKIPDYPYKDPYQHLYDQALSILQNNKEKKTAARGEQSLVESASASVGSAEENSLEQPEQEAENAE